MSFEEIICGNRCRFFDCRKVAYLPDIFPDGIQIHHNGHINKELISHLNTIFCCPVFHGRLDILKFTIHQAIWNRYQNYGIVSSLVAPRALQVGPRNGLLIEQFEIVLNQSFDAEQKRLPGRRMNAYMGEDLRANTYFRYRGGNCDCGKPCDIYLNPQVISCDITAIILAWDCMTEDGQLAYRSMDEFEKVVRW
jgi:hypothetical protein